MPTHDVVAVVVGPLQHIQENFIKLLGPARDVLSRQMRIRVLKSVPLFAKLSDLDLDHVSKHQDFSVICL